MNQLLVSITKPLNTYDYRSNHIIGGIGYYSGPYNVIFSAGETSALLDISVYNNNVFEDTTNFMLTISKFSLPDRINRGKPGNARINIVDDDGKW